MSGNESGIRASRRRVLSTVAGTGVAAIGALASKYGVSDAAALDAIDEISLGTFESSLEEWRPEGDLALSRVGRDERPVAVTEGEYALEAAVDGETEPVISRSVTDLDLATHPYFVADVTPGRLAGTDARVAFQCRLYRSTDLLADGSTGEPVAESDPVTVPQATPGRLYWDASDVDFGLLDAVSRLEIGWYPTDGDPADGTVAARGDVVVDDVRATASVDAVGSARLAATMRDLQFDRGPYVRTEVTETFDGGEAGAFVFADGETEPYRFETVGADRYLLAVADAEIEFGEGWS
ncbi:hypothetical protein [Haloterrigena gelatinilytica]|uniref:hypothetical protein n=1 Tax=Haloterrigena gelatinilytica TaxID=2741724 RepID=UPI001C2DF2DB|nr:hypothetical protein [Haloterrigena gelatinilytica]